MKRLLLLLFSCVLFLQPYCQAQPLTSEESPVTQSTAIGDIKGRLLLPANATTCPVVLLIAGSGPTDMDGNNPMMKNNSLKFLAEGLAQKGIASLRFDKRGIAGSAAAGKEESKLRFEDYVNDVTGWIDLLAKDKRFTGITVAGHSEGSLIGMLACQSRPEMGPDAGAGGGHVIAQGSIADIAGNRHSRIGPFLSGAAGVHTERSGGHQPLVKKRKRGGASPCLSAGTVPAFRTALPHLLV